MTNSPQRQDLTIGIELIDDPGWMGGTLYLRNLALCLAYLPTESRPTIRLLGPQSTVARFLEECGSPEIFGEQKGDTIVGRILRKLGWCRSAGKGIDVVYPGFGASVPGALTLRWVPDFQHCYLPDLFSAEEIKARDESISAIASAPGVVVFSSEVAANDFRRFFPRHRATPRVWHFCSLVEGGEVATDGSWRQRHGIPEKYLYLPNQFWAHKNHITVLKALAILRERHSLTIPLVCTGAQSDRRNAAHFDSLLGFVRESGITDQVHLLGLLPRSEQIEVLRGAAAVVQPSLFEGWSTVVEDARAIGRPIFLSDISVHREQAPQRGLFFSPESEKELAALLMANWPALNPGPDAAMERAARANMEGRILTSAQEFIDIAMNALAIQRISE